MCIHSIDREGRQLELIDGAGQIHRAERSIAGLVLTETTVDGREIRFTYSPTGNITSVKDGDSQTNLAWDALGRPTRREFSDGTVEEFEYDQHDQIVQVSSGDVICRFTYSPSGMLLREEQEFDGEATSVEQQFDTISRRTSLSSSCGASFDWDRDLRGRPVALFLDGRSSHHPLRHTYDPNGNELSRLLPGGGKCSFTWSAHGELTRCQVSRPSMEVLPARVGEPTGLIDHQWEYSLGGVLRGEQVDGEGSTKLDSDIMGRLIGFTTPDGNESKFSYDGAENIHPVGAATQYAAGNRLELLAGYAFRWDAQGRLIEKEELSTETPRVWRYEWGQRKMLTAVALPDGRTVRFKYDALARRVQKTVDTPDGETLVTTRYVWGGTKLLHSIERHLQAGSEEMVQTDYAWSDDSGELLAQRTWHTDAIGTRSGGDWRFVVVDPLDAPTRVISGDGTTLERLTRTPFGRFTSSAGGKSRMDVRLPGQFEDVETGLHYNQHRYYDPDLGRYISPDPIGVLGGLNLYAYVENRPHTHADYDGLGPKQCVITGAFGTITGYSSGDSRHTQPSTQTLPSSLESSGDGRKGILGQHFHGPHDCAEADAMSQLLNAGHSVKDIDSIETTDVATGKKAPCCTYCTERMARLSVENATNLFDKTNQGEARVGAAIRDGTTTHTKMTEALGSSNTSEGGGIHPIDPKTGTIYASDGKTVLLQGNRAATDV